MTQPARPIAAEGLAALGICESLMITLTDLKIITDVDARDLLNDVVTAHTNAAATSQTPEMHHAVVEIIRRILAGKNGTAHPVAVPPT